MLVVAAPMTFNVICKAHVCVQNNKQYYDEFNSQTNWIVCHMYIHAPTHRDVPSIRWSTPLTYFFQSVWRPANPNDSWFTK